MKALAMILVLFTLVGCKSLSVEVTAPDGTTWDIAYSVWGKSELSDVSASVGDVEFTLGSSSTDSSTAMDKVIDGFISGAIAPVKQP